MGLGTNLTTDEKLFVTEQIPIKVSWQAPAKPLSLLFLTPII